MLVRLVRLIGKLCRLLGADYEGDTFVMVSHGLNPAAMNADNLLLRNGGIIAGIGRPGKMLKLQTLEETYGVIGLWPS